LFRRPQGDTTLATAAVRHEFRFEFQNHLTSLNEKPNQAIVAVVGDEMKGHPGVSGKVFGALGRHNINISAIARALQSATSLASSTWRSKRVR